MVKVNIFYGDMKTFKFYQRQIRGKQYFHVFEFYIENCLIDVKSQHILEKV